jgi:hypothetical protein
MNELTEEISSTDEAFISAMTPKTLDGIELKPYSLMRQMVALELTGFEASGPYEAIFHVWVCTLEPVEVLATIVNKQSKEHAKFEAFAWAESHGVTINNMKPLLDLYKRLSDEIRASTKARPAKDRDAPKNDGRLPE